MAMLVAFCTACASSWKKNQASKNVVLEAMNRQVNALSKWRTLDFLGLGMGVCYFHLFVKLLHHASGFFGRESPAVGSSFLNQYFTQLRVRCYTLNAPSNRIGIQGDRTTRLHRPPLRSWGHMWLVMTGRPTICASKIGMPNPSRVEAKSKKSLVA